MKKLLVLLFTVLMSIRVDAVDTYNSVSTSQTGGRYEIIQSNIKRSLFFKLDKFSGDVYQYVTTSSGGYTWQKIYVEGKVFGDLNKSITFQLFVGGMAVADCILLNIETGETYQLYEDSKTKELYFSKFD